MSTAASVDRARILADVRKALRSVLDDPSREIRAEDRLVDDLGLDSTSIASLTIALEDVFDDVLLLSDWIAGASDPGELSVASLVDYLAEILAEAR